MKEFTTIAELEILTAALDVYRGKYLKARDSLIQRPESEIFKRRYETVKAISLEGVAPTAENIKAGNYFLSRPFVMATKGEIAQQDAVVQELFKYLESEEGKAVIQAVGLITVD